MSFAFHHCSLTVTDEARTKWFWLEFLGLSLHPKGNWFSLDGGQTFQIHVLPNDTPGTPKSLSRHIALQVATLEEIRDKLLDAKLDAFQTDIKGNAKPITSKEDKLDFGIETVFTHDPDGNTVEFVQDGRGLIGKIGKDPGAAS